VIISEIALENFGTYAGTSMLDVRSQPTRPIVLLGGTNGAGKTTILEAILLCLQGRRAVGTSVTAKEYQHHIASRIHVPPAGVERPTEAAVGLRFDHAERGVIHEYLVERRWYRNPGGSVREELLLVRDEAVVDDLPESAWQDFLDGLIPPGVANLFFFDGERIQALADDSSGERLKDAVRRLLGLDLVAQLQVDLSRYVGQADLGGGGGLRRRVAAAQDVCTAADDTRRQLRTEQAALATRHQKVAERVTLERERFARHGGMLAAQRGKLERSHEKALASAAVSEAKVRELIAGLLPFAICSELAARVRDRIAAEHSREEDEIVLRRIASARTELALRLTARDGSPVAELIARVVAGESDEVDEMRIHDLTSRERASLSDQLDRVLLRLPRETSTLARSLWKAEEERTRSRELLDKAPPTSDVSDMLDRLQQLEREVGAIEAEGERVAAQVQRAEYECEVAERELRRARETLAKEDGLSERVGHAVRAAAVLDEFESRALTAKLGRIEIEAARFFNRLTHKGSLLSRVEIDPVSFRVDLRRWDDAELPKDRLSAGEKQLLAIALLWALARVSGRPLPVVIDTPLARLDREHRERLLREYLPSVSHQVIVLSTDTEVDAAAAELLAPSVARTFHLVHDAEQCSTSVRDGYFAAHEEVAGAR
jgi:DNA sulfur modification protein DndD